LLKIEAPETKGYIDNDDINCQTEVWLLQNSKHYKLNNSFNKSALKLPTNNTAHTLAIH